jgi:micrococcal nuclease
MSSLSKYKIKIILIVIIAIITSIFSYYDEPRPRTSLDGLYEVISVIDGDTFEIKDGNKISTIRMLGIDTPETVDPRKEVQCFGKEASDKTKELILNKKVEIELDKTQSFKDKYGRILAYVKREDSLFINEFLVEYGYAHEYTYIKPYKYQSRFKKLEKVAREEKKGLWGLLCSKI